MKEKIKAVTGASEAVTEAAAQIVPVAASKTPEPRDGEIWYDVKPSELVSIVAGNRVLMLQVGVTGIRVHYQT